MLATRPTAGDALPGTMQPMTDRLSQRIALVPDTRGGSLAGAAQRRPAVRRYRLARVLPLPERHEHLREMHD